MSNLDILEEIFFEEIISEANRSEVTIVESDGYEHIYNIGFNACIEGKLTSGNFDDPKPILMIQNKKQLLNMLEKYILEVDKTANYFSDCEYRQKIKAYMAFVWNNAIYEDFANPCNYLKKQIDFLQNPLFNVGQFTYANNVDFSSVINSKNKSAVNLLNGSDIMVSVKKQGIKQETPFVFEITIKKEIDGIEYSYRLPSISYGISNEECYIYAIQDPKQDRDNSFAKSVNRIFYTLNSEISEQETNEYNDLKSYGVSEYSYYNVNQDGDIIYDYFPENISDVSPSAVIALTIFLDCLLKYKIDKVKVVSCLPVRYYGKELFYLKKHAFRVKKDNLTKEEADKLMLEYKKEHLRIQKNLSEKLIRNFRRIEHHYSNSLILREPLEMDEYLYFRFSEFTNSNNLLLNCITDKKMEYKIK